MCINTSNGVLTLLQVASDPLKIAQNRSKSLKIAQNRSKSLKIAQKLLKVAQNRLLAALTVDLDACFVLTPVLTPGLTVLTPLY